MISDLGDVVRSAVEDVFVTMFNTKLELVSAESVGQNGHGQVAGAVGLVGQLNGVICIYATASHAQRLARQLLALSESEEVHGELINDVVGELTNMIGGHVKSCLGDRGFPCRLSIPSIVRGSNFTIESVTDTVHHVAFFKAGTELIIVEVILKPTN
jgi:chemotaxis protein CheX